MGIIHRDIKPENVLLDGPDGNVRLTDFNTAFVSPSNEPLEEGSVYAQQKTGSEPYMAWEVSQHRWYGKMCDWWSLGCLMYDLVTGKVCSLLGLTYDALLKRVVPQLLFKNESKVAKYVAWDPRAEGRSYITRTCHLSKEEESVMNGVSPNHFPRPVIPLTAASGPPSSSPSRRVSAGSCATCGITRTSSTTTGEPAQFSAPAASH